MHQMRRYIALLTEQLEEDSVGDFDKLTEANRVFRLIATWLRAHGANAFFYQDGMVNDTKVVKLTLDLNRIESMPEEYKDLSLILTNMEQTDHGAFVKPEWGGHYYSRYRWHPNISGDTKAIVLYTLGSDIHVGVFEARMAGIFTHEFVHYLDDKRLKPGKRVMVGKRQVASLKGRAAYKHAPGTHEHMDEYINNPVEFNAYYMQGIRKVVEDLDRIIRLRENFPLDFRQFLGLFTVENQHFNGDFRVLMNADWRKKFIKRLYAFHRLIVERYRSGKPYTKLWWSALLKHEQES